MNHSQLPPPHISTRHTATSPNSPPRHTPTGAMQGDLIKNTEEAESHLKWLESRPPFGCSSGADAGPLSCTISFGADGAWLCGKAPRVCSPAQALTIVFRP